MFNNSRFSIFNETGKSVYALYFHKTAADNK